MFCTNGNCNYLLSNESDTPRSIEINGNYYELKKGLTTTSDYSTNLGFDGNIIETRLSKYIIEVYIWNNNWQLKRTVTYDNRDCGFLGGTGCSSCPNKGDNDLTIRFDADANKLYLYNGHNTDFINNLQQNPNWTEVGTSSYTSIKWWNIKQCNTGNYRCTLDVPSIVENVEVNGNNGQHPTISWDFSYDTDITNYNIYRSVDGAIFHKIATVTSSVNTYTDNSVTISGGQFSPEICYAVTALDFTNLESEKSASDCIHSDTFMEKRKSSSKGQDEILDNLFHVYPNPFNPETIVSYSVAKDGLVELTLYNILGKKIITLINGYKEMGKHTFNIDFDKIDRNLSSGIYIIIFKTNGNIFQQKINYIK